MISRISSKKEYTSYPATMFNISFVKGNGYGSFFVATYGFLKSIHIFSLPFFLGTTIMGDNHVVYFIDWMNPIANNLSIYFLTVVA
jgi:hypothetical protein